MAVCLGSLGRVKLKYPKIDMDNIKVIAWGAGQWFHDYYPIIDIPVSYTICPLNAGDGKTIHNVPVVSPDILKDEFPERCLIIIFSASSNEITNQIRAFGNFPCIPALNFGRSNLNAIESLAAFKRSFDFKYINKIKNKRKDLGFFYQGPIFPYTELALAYQRFFYPEFHHIFVTDKGQNSKLINRCKKWVDELIEMDVPENTGFLNRNSMIQTAYAGVKRLKELNVDISVRVRSGNIIYGDFFKFLNDSYFAIKKQKIGFYMGWSWKNIPFHISDAFMIGKTDVIEQLWALPLDPRLPNDFPNLFFTNQLDHFSILTNSNECYLWSHFAKSKGYRTDTLNN